MKIGNFITQAGGYKAFIPGQFPPKARFKLSPEVTLLSDQAALALGKLDGVAQLIPDIDFFIFMYVRKEAALSSNIEGTKATMYDSLKANLEITEGVPRDVENIVHYIIAMKYGIDRLTTLPLSSRLLKEIHHKLMHGTAEGLDKTPGEYRKTQNWINGTRPENADFVPPPPHELNKSLGDLEVFLNQNSSYSPLIKAGLVHAQFETVHPFLDGNGRIGRLLITLQLCHEKVLEYPILYLSEYFKRHREVYFKRLSEYHNNSEVDRWLAFFLEGVREVAAQATEVSKAIVRLREADMQKIHALGGKQAPSAVKLLMVLYKQPIIDAAKVASTVGLTRPAANALIRRFVEVGILVPADKEITYGRTFSYDAYLRLFSEQPAAK